MTVTAPPEERPQPQPRPTERRAISLFQPDIVRRALIDSVIKLDPRVQIRNPVMFVVEIGAVITTVTWLIQVFGGKALGGNDPGWYTFTISFWLWLTVVCSPTWPRRSPRAAGEPRPTRCVRCARRPWRRWRTGP